MGVWTHINGNVRIDNLDQKEKIEKIIEKEFKNTLLSYNVIPYYHKECIRGYNIVIWADLDEFSNIDKFEKWFNQLTHASKLLIREGILQIEIPYIDCRLLIYGGDKNKTVYYK